MFIVPMQVTIPVLAKIGKTGLPFDHETDAAMPNPQHGSDAGSRRYIMRSVEHGTRTPLVVSLLSSICQHPGGHVLSGQEADWPRSGAIRCLQIG
ncbi:hypothetical protein CN160_27625 [Sinorhizobium meliloti]|nr:hypothetical protein CN160_27625 [Sinorhizobium meliloti]